MLEFHIRMNGGNRSPESLSAVKQLITERFRLVDMGYAQSLIDFRNPELINAFSTEKDGTQYPMDPEQMVEAFSFVMQYRNDKHYTPMYERGEIVDDPDDFYLVDDAESGWYQVMSHNRAYDCISAPQIANIWFKHKAGELNEAIMDQTQADPMDTFDNPTIPKESLAWSQVEDTKGDKEYSPISRLLRSDRKPSEMLKPRSYYTTEELAKYKRDNGLGKTALTFPTEEEYQKQIQTFNKWAVSNPLIRDIIGNSGTFAKGANDSTALLNAFINKVTAGNAGKPFPYMPESDWWILRMLPEFTESDEKFSKKKK